MWPSQNPHPHTSRHTRSPVPTTTFKMGSKKGMQSDLKAGMRVVVNVGDGVEPLKAKEVQYSSGTTTTAKK